MPFRAFWFMMALATSSFPSGELKPDDGNSGQLQVQARQRAEQRHLKREMDRRKVLDRVAIDGDSSDCAARVRETGDCLVIVGRFNEILREKVGIRHADSIGKREQETIRLGVMLELARPAYMGFLASEGYLGEDAFYQERKNKDHFEQAYQEFFRSPGVVRFSMVLGRDSLAVAKQIRQSEKYGGNEGWAKDILAVRSLAIPDTLIPENFLFRMQSDPPGAWTQPARTDLGWLSLKVDSVRTGHAPEYQEVRHLVSTLTSYFHESRNQEELKGIIKERCESGAGEYAHYQDFSADICLPLDESCACGKSDGWKSGKDGRAVFGIPAGSLFPETRKALASMLTAPSKESCGNAMTWLGPAVARIRRQARETGDSECMRNYYAALKNSLRERFRFVQSLDQRTLEKPEYLPAVGAGRRPLPVRPAVTLEGWVRAQYEISFLN